MIHRLFIRERLKRLWKRVRIFFGQEVPLVQTMLGEPRKSPECKSPNCDANGFRTDIRFGKRLGGGRVNCNCCTWETKEINRANRIRKIFGQAPLEY